MRAVVDVLCSITRLPVKLVADLEFMKSRRMVVYTHLSVSSHSDLHHLRSCRVMKQRTAAP